MCSNEFIQVNLGQKMIDDLSPTRRMTLVSIRIGFPGQGNTTSWFQEGLSAFYLRLFGSCVLGLVDHGGLERSLVTCQDFHR